MAAYASSCVLLHSLAGDEVDGSSGGLAGIYLGLMVHPLDRKLPLTEYFIPENSSAFAYEMQFVDTKLGREDWVWPMPSSRRPRLKFEMLPFVGQIVRVDARKTLGVIVGWSLNDQPNNEESLDDFDVKVTFGIIILEGRLYWSTLPMKVHTCKEALPPLQVSRATLRMLYRDRPILGYYFSDAEFFSVATDEDDNSEGKARFVPNSLFNNLYPDDDAVGAAWVRS